MPEGFIIAIYSSDINDIGAHFYDLITWTPSNMYLRPNTLRLRGYVIVMKYARILSHDLCFRLPIEQLQCIFVKFLIANNTYNYKWQLQMQQCDIQAMSMWLWQGQFVSGIANIFADNGRSLSVGYDVNYYIFGLISIRQSIIDIYLSKECINGYMQMKYDVSLFKHPSVKIRVYIPFIVCHFIVWKSPLFHANMTLITCRRNLLASFIDI